MIRPACRCGDGGLLLDFARELHGASDVTVVEDEVGVEVFLRRDVCGVVGAGTLGHVTLKHTHTHTVNQLSIILPFS